MFVYLFYFFLNLTNVKSMFIVSCNNIENQNELEVQQTRAKEQTIQPGPNESSSKTYPSYPFSTYLLCYFIKCY